MDFNNICSVCLSSGDVLCSLLDMNDTQITYAEILKFCSSKDVNYHLLKICKNCILDLLSVYKFLKKWQISYQKIYKYLAELNTKDRITSTYICTSTEGQIIEGETKYVIEISDTKIENQDSNEEYNDSIFEIGNSNLEHHSSPSDEIDAIDNIDEIEIKNKTKKKPKALYFCKLCEKSFKSKKLHDERVHGERKIVQCERCSATFVKPYSLSLHMRQHDNILPYVCSHPGCQKSFPIPSLLKQHSTSHSGERRFVCQYCSHGSRTKQQLFVHIRYHHTKVKDYICSYCSKGFVSYQARYSHEKRHKNIRDHACQYCDRTFVCSGNLTSHLLTHTGVKNFACRICATRFTRKAHRDKHEANVHGISDWKHNKVL